MKIYKFFMKFPQLKLGAMLFFLVGCAYHSVMPVRSSTAPEETLTTPSSSHAAEVVAQSQCWQNATTQSDFMQCATEDLGTSEQRLDSLLNRISARVSSTRSQELLQIQADWKKVVADHCKWQADFAQGGSIRPMVYYECINRQYLDRMEALRLNLCEAFTGECEESLPYKDQRRCR